jgi:hypothetical protein
MSSTRLQKAKRLLDESPEAYYWMGFILADGSFINNNVIAIRLKEDEKEHLEKMGSFLEINNKIAIYQANGYRKKDLNTKSCNLVITDVENVPLIKEKFRIPARKTYNPPTLPEMTREQFLSLFAGYIDGDGCISTQGTTRYRNKKGEIVLYPRTDCIIQIKCHSSWLETLKIFEERLHKELGFELTKSKVGINKQGFCLWRIQNGKIVKSIKEGLQKLNLPLLLRKWNKIQ